METQTPTTPTTPAEPTSRPERTERPPRAPRPYSPRGMDNRDSRDQRDQGGRGERRFGPPIRRVCPFCTDSKKKIDYKDGDSLRRYLNDRGKIKPRRKIGTCSRHQRRLSLAIKRARVLALLPYAPAHIHGV